MEPKTVAEITLQGTLQEFLTFVQSFSFENGRIQVRGERDWVSLELMTPYAGHRYQQIGQFYKLRWDGHARGSVVQLPNGKALLRLGMAEGAWESLTPLWQELTGLLKKHGFLDSTADKATEQTGQGNRETGNEKYWRDVIRQATSSGNVRGYLEDRRISKSTYYDWKERLGL